MRAGPITTMSKATTNMSQTAHAGLEFSRKCIGWRNATYEAGKVLRNEGSFDRFDPSSWEDTWPLTRHFLGNRYWIQMNRDLSTNARWRVLIGTQNVVHRESLCGTVEVIDDDQNRAIMSACVLAADRLNLKEM
jgi:hypothetical protein